MKAKMVSSGLLPRDLEAGDTIPARLLSKLRKGAIKPTRVKAHKGPIARTPKKKAHRATCSVSDYVAQVRQMAAGMQEMESIARTAIEGRSL